MSCSEEIFNFPMVMIVRENLYWNCTCKIIHACLEMILINRELIIRKLKKKKTVYY